MSNDEHAARSFNLYAGTEGIFVDVEFPQTSTDHIIKCLRNLWQRGKLTEDDLVLVTAVGYPRSGNRMNLLQTHSHARPDHDAGMEAMKERYLFTVTAGRSGCVVDRSDPSACARLLCRIRGAADRLSAAASVP